MSEVILKEEAQIRNDGDQTEKYRLETLRLQKEKDNLNKLLHDEEKSRQEANKELEALARKDNSLSERLKEIEVEKTEIQDKIKRFELSL